MPVKVSRFAFVKRLTLLLALSALPAVAKVARPEVRPRMQMSPSIAIADMDVSFKAAPPRRLQLDRAATVLDGLTVLELDHDRTTAVRRVVLKPEFIGGPGATFALNF